MRSTFLNTLIGIGMLAVTGTAQAVLIGVDFGGGALPTNWNVGPSSGNTPLFLNNLIGEDGVATTVDLQIDGVTGNDIQSSTFTPNAGHIPTHSQSLTGLNAITVDGGGITITLSDLIPGETYELWLFGGSNANNEVDDVTILHGGANISFTQNIASTGDMWVNGSIGSNAALSTFAETVTATASGTVTINIVDGGANGAGVAGLMLQRISHAVTTSAAGTGSGTTGGDGSYDFGSTVNLTATANPGSIFINWSGHVLCAASFTVPDEPVSCAALFGQEVQAIPVLSIWGLTGLTGLLGLFGFGALRRRA